MLQSLTTEESPMTCECQHSFQQALEQEVVPATVLQTCSPEVEALVNIPKPS